MNDTPHPDPRDQLHARVTAWLLGELPPPEAAAMAERVRRDSELRRLADSLRRAIGLLRAASAAPGSVTETTAPAEPLQLAGERREKLLAHFKTVPLPQAKVTVVDTSARSHKVFERVILYGAGLACVLVLASLLMPALSKSKATALRVKQAAEDKQRELEERLAEIDRETGATASRRMAAIELPAAETPDDFVSFAQAGRTGGAAIPTVRYTTVADSGIFNRSEPAPASSAPAFSGQAGRLIGTSIAGTPIYASAPARRHDDSECSGCSCSGPTKPARPLATPVPARPQISQAAPQRRAIALGDSEAQNAQTPRIVAQLPPPRIQTAPPPEQLTEYFAQPTAGDGSKFKDKIPVMGDMPLLDRLFRTNGSVGTVTVQPADGYATINGNPVATTESSLKQAAPLRERWASEALVGVERAWIPPVLPSDPASRSDLSDAEKAEESKKRMLILLESQQRYLSDQRKAMSKTPAASAPVPQPEVFTADNAFSTFSLNVSDVSFQLAAASLAQGRMPDAATVRAEEFLNAIDLRDPEPPPGAPLAFASERARHPFAHNRDLLRLSLKTAALGRAAGQRMNLVLLLDNSGSMERADRVRILHEAMRALAGLLGTQDSVSVVGFARTAHLWLDGAPGERAGQIPQLIGARTPEGGTNIEEALRLGYETARRHYIAGGINHVVLLTDGAANLGDVEPESLRRTVVERRREGIALDCFGIGWEGFNDDLLEALARHGDGRYGFLNSPEEAETEFATRLAGALRVAAADVKVQVEFNPRRVTAWRQLGYAKHQLTKEQFRDNTVDAAELTAREAANALYTVALAPEGSGPVATVRARFRVPDTGEYREHSWEVPFDGTAPALDQSGPAMRLASTAALFAEWLAGSPFADGVTPDALAAQLRGVPELFGTDPRLRQLGEMLRQVKSLSGK
jgi:Mg-chelatase subunit ChlD